MQIATVAAGMMHKSPKSATLTRFGRPSPWEYARIVDLRTADDLAARLIDQRVIDQRGPPGFGMIGLVTRRGGSRPGAGVLASCISVGACSRVCRHQTGQRDLCPVHDG